MKDIFKTQTQAGTFLLPLSIVITILLSMVTLPVLLIWFQHMGTILVVLLVFLNLTLYIKLPYILRTVFRTLPAKTSYIYITNHMLHDLYILFIYVYNCNLFLLYFNV